MYMQKRKLFKFLAICFFLSSLFGVYFGQVSQKAEENKKINPIEQSFSEQVVSKNSKITFGELYKQCQHLINEIPPGNFYGYNLNQLTLRFPPAEDWVIDNLNANRIIIYKNVSGLCPEDAKKRHLGAQGDYVAVFKGPIGINGGLERVTEIKLKELPTEFKLKLAKGELDFYDENELMDALDTIDEYMQ